jgi:hypothetical protein
MSLGVMLIGQEAERDAAYMKTSFNETGVIHLLSEAVKEEALSKRMYNTGFFYRNWKTCSEHAEIRVLKSQVRGNRRIKIVHIEIHTLLMIKLRRIRWAGHAA